MGDLPSVSFVVKPKDQSLWLLRKMNNFEKTWRRNNDGKTLMRKVRTICRLPFPKTVDSITVTFQPGHGYGRLLGECDMDDPSKITLYVKKNQSYLNLKYNLCHELIHSICWCNIVFDGRRTATSFFADYFADELLTTILQAYIIKGKITSGDYEWALDYARDGACTKLERLKKSQHYGTFINELEIYFACYRRDIKQRKTNALLERQRMLKDVISPNDS